MAAAAIVIQVGIDVDKIQTFEPPFGMRFQLEQAAHRAGIDLQRMRFLKLWSWLMGWPGGLMGAGWRTPPALWTWRRR